MWGNHGDWMESMGGFMGLGWIMILTVIVAVVWLLMRGTMFGLRLKAVGRNPASARLMGIRTDRYLLGAFGLCGALAGVAGTIQVAGVWHKLVPSVSGGYGFLAILVALLAAFRALRVPSIGLFFAIASVGSAQLTLLLYLNSAIGGVLQAIVVLFVLLAGGWQLRMLSKRKSVAAAEAEAPATVAELQASGPAAPVEASDTAGV